MQLTYLKKVAEVGITDSIPRYLLYKIALTNLFSFHLSILITVAALISLIVDEHRELSYLRLAMGVIYLLPLLCNWRHCYTASRFALMLLPIVMLAAMGALWGAEPATSLKIGVMPVVILPAILFGIKEKGRMIGGFILVFLSPLLFDTIVAIAPMPDWVEADVFSKTTEINVTILVSLLMFMLSYIFYQLVLHHAEETIIEKSERAETLLRNILPEEIIPILKENPDVIAEHFDDTSILFADIVNFTPLAARKSAHEIVQILNQVFTHFDGIVENHGLEKIKTIGDCYMAASGVPRSRKDHAKVLVEVAFEFQNYIREMRFDGEQLELRIGISSGSVIGGVIGRKKFIYDLWGDTVNTASRMESQGRIGEIQITEETKLLIEDTFLCEQLENIHVKGKGDMAIYLVKDKIA